MERVMAVMMATLASVFRWVGLEIISFSPELIADGVDWMGAEDVEVLVGVNDVVGAEVSSNGLV